MSICRTNSPQYYLPVVLEEQVGLTPFLARLIAACNGTEYFLASWISVFTIEKFGRRKVRLTSSERGKVSNPCLR